MGGLLGRRKGGVGGWGSDPVELKTMPATEIAKPKCPFIFFLNSRNSIT